METGGLGDGSVGKKKVLEGLSLKVSTHPKSGRAHLCLCWGGGGRRIPGAVGLTRLAELGSSRFGERFRGIQEGT